MHVTYRLILLSLCLLTACSLAENAPAPAATPARHDAVYPDPLPAPLVGLTSVTAEPIGRNNPGYFGYEIGGRHLADALFLAGVVTESGERNILYAEPLPVGDNATGIYDGVVLWDGHAFALTDGVASTFVIGEPVGGPGVIGVQGTLRQSGGVALDVTALFDSGSGMSVGMQAADGKTAIVPDADASFAPQRIVINADGGLVARPGASVSAEQMRLRREMLPNDVYFAGIAVDNVSDVVNAQTVAVTVANDDGSQIAYLDPIHGYQFSYAVDWTRPVMSDDGLLTAGSPDGVWQLRIRPIVAETTPQQLMEEVLAAWDGVSVLFEDQPTVADAPALRTFYGYFDPANVQHTGAVLTFAHDGIGYVVDVEGKGVDEAALIALADGLASGWLFRPIHATDNRIWNIADGVYTPVGFVRAGSEQGWDRFTDVGDNQRFFAQRRDQAQPTRTASELAAYWVNIAASGQQAFVTDDMQQVVYADGLWSRLGFSYITGDAVPMQGALWVQVTDSAENVIWIESPADSFAAVEELALITLAANAINLP